MVRVAGATQGRHHDACVGVMHDFVACYAKSTAPKWRADDRFKGEGNARVGAGDLVLAARAMIRESTSTGSRPTTITGLSSATWPRRALPGGAAARAALRDRQDASHLALGLAREFRPQRAGARLAGEL